jgi:hypothetical protein
MFVIVDYERRLTLSSTRFLFIFRDSVTDERSYGVTIIRYTVWIFRALQEIQRARKKVCYVATFFVLFVSLVAVTNGLRSCIERTTSVELEWQFHKTADRGAHSRNVADSRRNGESLRMTAWYWLTLTRVSVAVRRGGTFSVNEPGS